MAVPRVVLTSGEPAGIGPDLCLAVAGRDRSFDLVVVGDPDTLLDRASALGIDVALEAYDPAVPPAPHRGGRLRVLPRRVTARASPGRLDQVPAWGELCRKTARARLAWLYEELASRPFLAGERYTVADITALCALDFGRVVDIRIAPAQKNLARWHESVSSRPSARA